ncbi:MAG: GGDEF domain-containing protein [Spirochaetia bacterium]|nr:GGDEF domain-containing protein [Spirochaetia bacterium]
MLKNIIIKQGLLKSILFFTLIIVFLSVLGTSIITLILTGVLPDKIGFFISTIMPAILVPSVGLWHFKLIIELHATQQKLYKYSFIDELTNTYNRRYILEILQKEMSRAKRYNTNLSIMILDIDNFKKINDNYGHLEGDKMLKRFADSCKANMRDNDYFGRYGGEEFLYILTNTEKENAVLFAERLREMIVKLCLISEDKKISLTTSIGVSEYKIDTDDLDSFLDRTDKALYKAKEKGKNCVFEL